MISASKNKEQQKKAPNEEKESDGILAAHPGHRLSSGQSFFVPSSFLTELPTGLSGCSIRAEGSSHYVNARRYTANTCQNRTLINPELNDMAHSVANEWLLFSLENAEPF